ncbi:MAG: AAA family ATPase [Oscillospiraceae bacterium]
MKLGNRIMVMGPSGSGKSTMAMRLGEITGVPVVHIDRFIWNPGWIATPEKEVCEKVLKAADEPKWIMDGNNSKTRDYRLERADTVIFLDFNRFFCLFRNLKRFKENYGQTRHDLGEACPERLNLAHLKFILWTFPRARNGILAWLSKIEPPKQVFYLKGTKAVMEFLTEVCKSSSTQTCEIK